SDRPIVSFKYFVPQGIVVCNCNVVHPFDIKEIIIHDFEHFHNCCYIYDLSQGLESFVVVVFDIFDRGDNFPDTLLVVAAGVFDIFDGGDDFPDTLLVVVDVFDIDDRGVDFPDTLLVVVDVFDIDESGNNFSDILLVVVVDVFDNIDEDDTDFLVIVVVVAGDNIDESDFPSKLIFCFGDGDDVNDFFRKQQTNNTINNINTIIDAAIIPIIVVEILNPLSTNIRLSSTKPKPIVSFKYSIPHGIGFGFGFGFG
ncbi:hypothetical protein DERP_004279, partial [Dermatophagoides pteronyssinus]